MSAITSYMIHTLSLLLELFGAWQFYESSLKPTVNIVDLIITFSQSNLPHIIVGC